jgi:hypothetical protein
MVRGAELRIAETRAVNRTLRKAYGIGLCSAEELGAFSSEPRKSPTTAPSNGHPSSNGSGNGQPRLRDQLCLLIRQYNLDANLVKAMPRLKLPSADYQVLRKQILERDGWRCQLCGTPNRLEVHDIKSRGSLRDDTLQNLITLCAKCHRTFHRGGH